MKSKKSQGISITTIIIAALALVVLVILIAVFTGRMGIWGQGLDDTTKGNDCESDEVKGLWKVKCGDGETAIYGIFSDANDHPGQSCCKASG